MEAVTTKYQIQTLTEGDKTNFPKAGNQVTVHYVGTFPTNGKKFDSSRDKKKPFVFKLGKGEVIKGWDDVAGTMSLGQKVYFICPADCAYGEDGAGDIIPPNAELAFEVELLSFK